jgi:pyrophosphatase PpaX
MNSITAILFDIDGTILDTTEFIIQATEHALSTLGYKVSERALIAKTVGVHFPEYYFLLAGKDADTDKLIEEHRAFQYENYHLVRPFPGAFDTLKSLHEKGYKLAAVTTRSRKTSYQTLADAGIFELFDTVVYWEDVKEHKPHPEPLFKALELLDVVPENTVMVGDSHLDIEAGKNAGTKTIRAAYGFHKDNLHTPEPDVIIQDIRDLLKIL